MNKDSLIVLDSVRKYFPVKGGTGSRKSQVKAVDGVTLEIAEGETLGLVGESGCGKSSLGRCILRLFPLTGGTITYRGQDISLLTGKDLPNFRKNCQMIFQDPAGCLNPRRTVRELLMEPLIIHHIGTSEEKDRMIMEITERVGIGRHYLERYPHEMSGGQKQRIGIARALLLKPEFIVCDEPVSALDASIQAQVLNLLKELREERKLTYLFISHNLSVVNYVSDRVGVMYCGKLVELAEKHTLYQHAAHPYTKALIAAIPDIQGSISQDAIPEGDVPNPIAPPSGCRFHPRCPLACEKCKTDPPELRNLGNGHLAACHFA